VVDVAEQKVVHWSVPIASVLVPGDTVPPVAVEAAVSEASDFGEHVEHAFLVLVSSTYQSRDHWNTYPNDIPRQQLLQQKWKQHVTDNPWKLKCSLLQ